MNLLFYDVETANSRPGSICAVGWVLMDGSGNTKEGYSLIDPGCSFSAVNVKIHGITRDMVKGAPSFGEYWSTVLEPLFEISVAVAHNAHFDISATVQALLAAGAETPCIDYVDSIPIIQRYATSESFSLQELATQIGYTYKAHNALEDVKALISVLEYICQALGADGIPDLLLHGLAERTVDKTYSCPQNKPFVPMRRTEPKPEAPAQLLDEKLKGLKICVTGDVPGLERTQVEEMILLHGGQAMRSVSGKTDYLVVGAYPEFGPDFISSKQKKAMEVIAGGGKVKIISPEEFMQMLG